MTVHLVNLTNPMAMKGPVREIIPLSRQQLRITVPAGKHIAKAQLLVAERNVPHRQQGDIIQLEVPSIDLHEVVALDFST
jgi:hypothetical protein